MAEKTKSLEFKVGIFVFVGLVAFGWFVLKIGDFKIMKIGYDIKAQFGFANGIKIGAPVRIAGVDKGEVKEIILGHDQESGKPVIIIRAWIDGQTVVPRDSRIWVNTLGLLGEKYLEIIPGTNYNDVLASGDLIVGEDPTSVQEVTDLTKDIALQAKETLATVDKTVAALNIILDDVHAGRGTVGRLFTDDKLYTDIEEMFADLKLHPWKLLYRPKDAN